MTDDSDWAEWSVAKLEEAALKGALAINDVVYAELSVRYDRIEDLEAMLEHAAIEVASTPREALCFWPPRPFRNTASLVGREQACSRTFSSAPMPP